MTLALMPDFTFKHVNQVDEPVIDSATLKDDFDSRARECRDFINGTLKTEVDSKISKAEAAKHLVIADMINDFAVSGNVPSTSTTLTTTIPEQIAYVLGQRVDKTSEDHTFTASTDTYIDLGTNGAYTYVEVANAAAEPAVTANSMRMFKVVTDASTITTVTDMRTTKPKLNKYTEVTADPTTALGVSSKQYVDTNLYAHKADTAAHGATASATANTIALRDANGNVVSALPVTNGYNPNILFNPAFNLGSAGWSGIGVDGFSIVFGNAGGGSYLWNATSASGMSVNSGKMTIAPSTTLTLSGEMYATGVTAGNIQVQLNAYDASDAFLAQASVSATNGTGWTKYSATFTVPANTSYVRVICYMSSGITNTGAGWRKIKVEQGSIATTFSDDNTLNTVQYASPLTSALTTSASGIWTPASGTFNVAAGTVINVAAVPSGAKMFFAMAVAGDINSQGSAWGITTSSGSAYFVSAGSGTTSAAVNTGSATAISSTSVNASNIFYDGSYGVYGYFQINNGYLQYVTTASGVTAANAQNTIRWGVA